MPFDGSLDCAGGPSFPVAFFAGYKYGVAFFPGTKQRYPSRTWEGDWEGFVGELRKYSQKKVNSSAYATLYSPTAFIQNERKRVNTTTSGIIPLDLDHNTFSFDELQAAVADLGLAAVIYTTKRNETLGPGCRMRLVVPLSDQVDIWGYRAAVREIIDVLRTRFPGLAIDETKVTPESEFYVPARYRGAVNKFVLLPGEPWNVDSGFRVRRPANDGRAPVNEDVLRLLGRLPKTTYRAGSQKMPWMKLDEAGRAPFVAINDRNYVHTLAVTVPDVGAALERLGEAGFLPNIRTRNCLIWLLEKAVGLHTDAQRDRYEGWLRSILAGLSGLSGGQAVEFFAAVANPLHGEVIHERFHKLGDFDQVQPRGGHKCDDLIWAGDNKEGSRVIWIFDTLRNHAYRNARPGMGSDYYRNLLVPYREEMREAAIRRYGPKDHDVSLCEVDAVIDSIARWMPPNFNRFKEVNRGRMELHGQGTPSDGGRFSSELRRKKSRRRPIKDYLARHPHASRSELKGIFPDVSIRTIDYVRAEFRRLRRQKEIEKRLTNTPLPLPEGFQAASLLSPLCSRRLQTVVVETESVAKPPLAEKRPPSWRDLTGGPCLLARLKERFGREHALPQSRAGPNSS
jgi:hypothetical protein